MPYTTTNNMYTKEIHKMYIYKGEPNMFNVALTMQNHFAFTKMLYFL